MSSKDLSSKYPSVSLAYDLAIKSYDSAVERANNMDSKIQSLISLSCALTFAIPVVSRNLQINLDSYWFWVIIITFVVTVFVGLVGRFLMFKGDLRYFDPGKLYENNLHLSEWEFKKDFIYYAGPSFKWNTRLVHSRWYCALAMSFLLALEVLLMVIWWATHLWSG